MGIRMITSLNIYAKNMKMAARWQERQVTADYAPDETAFVDHSFQNKVGENDQRPERSEQMEMDIEIKLNAGKKLSAEEMLYLKTYAPNTYQKAKTIYGLYRCSGICICCPSLRRQYRPPVPYRSHLPCCSSLRCVPLPTAVRKYPLRQNHAHKRFWRWHPALLSPHSHSFG